MEADVSPSEFDGKLRLEFLAEITRLQRALTDCEAAATAIANDQRHTKEERFGAQMVGTQIRLITAKHKEGLPHE
jgi:hypothetical protein